MNEQDKISDFSNGCIPSDMLLRYIRGELSGFERNQVERHLATCEMCSDEYEGLISIQDPSKIKIIANKLNERIDEIVSTQKDKSIPLWGTYLKIAASIVLILGISSLVLFYATFKETPKHFMAENEIFDIAAPSPILESSKLIDKEAIGGIENQINKEKIAQGKSLEKKSEEGAKLEQPAMVKYIAPVVADSISQMVTNDEMIAEVKPEMIDTQKVADSEAVVMEEVVTTAYGVAKKAEARDVSGRNKLSNMEPVAGVAITKDRKNNSDYLNRKTLAIDLYDSQKYRNALSVFIKLKRDFPSNDSVIYYTALCNYQLKRYIESINEFKAIVGNPKSLLYSKAKWYYALSLKNEGRVNEAKSILMQIIEEDSTLKADANKELQSINPKE